MRVKKHLPLNTMDSVYENPAGNRIARFFARQAKKAAKEAAVYAKLAGSSAKTVDAADQAPEVLRALTSAPGPSAAMHAEMTPMSETPVADLTKVASALGVPTNDQAGEELSSRMSSACQATVASPSGTPHVNRAVMTTALGTSSIIQMSTVLPKWREEALMR